MEYKDVAQYIDAVPEDKRAAFRTLRETILANLPEGFSEELNYGMPGYVVPLSKYFQGYHTGKGIPLPFIGLAAQKHYISFYHLGIYARNDLLEWFKEAYASKGFTHKLDMGKSCIRFKYIDEIPFDLIAELVKKIDPDEWIAMYERGHLR